MDGSAPGIEETHISVLFLVGDRVYKLKKPVHFPFLDWRRREDRQRACALEVELNRRLSPDVYLGVVDLVQDGEPCDHLVAMRRMPDDRRLRTMVQRGDDVRPGLDALADLLAAFHRSAGHSAKTAQWADRDAVRTNWRDNVAVLDEHRGVLVDGAVVDRVAALADRYLAGRRPLFEARAAAGLHVDGHGDLLADDIYLLDDGPRVLDCLEFSPQLRAVDVLDDIAFLAMDLEHLGAPELAEHLVRAYAARSGTPCPPSLLDHYVAYRAGVRAKVACLRADQGGTAEAGPYLDLARRHLEAGKVRLVLVGGLPGTGKSTLASGIARARGWTLLRSDVVRKELAGLDPATHATSSFREGLYREEHTAATYGALLTRARAELALGTSVVLDATWLDPERRADAARVARCTSSALVSLRCTAPPALAAERLGKRPPGEPSDATPAIAAAMAGRAGPWPEAVLVPTDGPVEVSLGAALEACR